MHKHIQNITSNIKAKKHSIVPILLLCLFFNVQTMAQNKINSAQNVISHNKPTLYTSNGNKVLQFPNGAKIIKTKKGQTLFITPNGKQHEFSKKAILGNKQKLVKQEEIFKDKKSIQYRNGQSLTVSKNGTRKVQFPNGGKKVFFPNKTILIIFPAGGKRYIFSSGKKLDIGTDNSMILYLTNGQKLYKKADGQIITRKQGEFYDVTKKWTPYFNHIEKQLN